MCRGFGVRFARPAVLAGLAVLLIPASASAGTLTVDTTDETSATECTLPEAISAANFDSVSPTCGPASGGDVINITATGTIDLTAGLLINSNIDINGPGSGQLDIHRADTAGPFRVITVSSGKTASIADVSVSNGRSETIGQPGSGIANFGTLDLDHVVVRDNVVVNEGDQPNQGPAPTGGGITNLSGVMTITDSTITGNTVSASHTATSGAGIADASGGGIFNITGTVTILRSTISDNTASAEVASNDASSSAFAAGGGIGNGYSGTLTIRASTVSGNTATASAPAPAFATTRGGGIFDRDGGSTLTAVGDTIANNSAELSASVSAQGTETITDTILANDDSAPNCDAGDIETDGGFNISFPTPCAGLNAALVDPQLQPLDDYGGPTETMALGVTSPALDAGISGGISLDQRSISRPYDIGPIPNAPGSDGSDIGALEALDPDGDGIPSEVDQCGGASGGGNPTGCPDEPRELSLRYSRHAKRFKGKLTAATVSVCASERTVTVFRKRAGADKVIGQATTSLSGGYSLDRRAKPGKYYSAVEEEVVADVADCLAERSPTVRVKRRR